jgi:hypothetical protein
VPCSTGDSSLNVVTVAVCGERCLASVPQFIAMPASRCDVGSSVCTAIPPRSQVFGCALHLAYLTNANSVRAGEFRRITDTHLASAVIAKLALGRIGLGPKMGNSSCHEFDVPS